MVISHKLRALLKTAESVCVLTGAGISAESGVETFRGSKGLWSKLKPEELANFNAFMRNPELVWEWYNYRKKIVQEVTPNPAHYALARLQELVKDFTLVTQNIDNLHIRAGSKEVLELHGNIERSYCISCGKFAEHIEVTPEKKVPHCSSCNGIIRPDIVWFGEMLPEGVFESASDAAERCELFLTVGTSAVVYPAAQLPLTAQAHGAYVVEINMERTEISHRLQETLLGKAGEILPELLKIREEKKE
ncbi:MAG: NAD-dependent deacylase [Ignavibacteriae bacterium]|nr:MAG: NAD-dependent deacylase [Ignavibacteriota bacterium]